MHSSPSHPPGPAPHRCRPAIVLALLSLTVLLLLPVPSAAQLVNGRFITSAYSFEQFDTVDVSERYLRVNQAALIDVIEGDFGLYTYFLGAGTNYASVFGSTSFRAPYLYAQWRNLGGSIDLSLGRMPVWAGVRGTTIDGARTTFRFGRSGNKFTIYGGWNTPVDLRLSGWGSLDKNFVLGGQYLIVSIPDVRLGLSYFNRMHEVDPYTTQRPDSFFNPISTVIEPPPTKEQLFGVDLSWQIDGGRLYARYDYDLNYQSTSRWQAGISGSITPEIWFSGDFLYRKPYARYQSWFSVSPVNAIGEFEAGLDFLLLPRLRAFVRGAYVEYGGFAPELDDNAFRYTVGVAHDYLQVTYRGTAGYAGELSSITVDAVYPLLDRMLIPSIGLSWQSYKLDELSSKEDALAVVAGATVRPWQWISLDLQGQWLNTRVYESDVRVFARLNLWFSERLSIL